MYPAIARVAYHVNRGYLMVLGEQGGPAWAACSQTVKQAFIQAVERVHKYWNAITPAELHALWMNDMLQAGWSYGEGRSEVLKLDPSLVPFSDLAIDRRARYAIIIEVTKGVLPLAQELQQSSDLLKHNAEQSELEQRGALLYIAAMVKRFGGETGIVHLSKADMLAACEVELMRHDTEDEGLILKVERQGNHAEYKADPAELDTSLPPNG